MYYKYLEMFSNAAATVRKIKRITRRFYVNAVICALLSALFPATASEGPLTSIPENPYPEIGKVNLIRDIWGVPHVYAQTETDGLFGAGYALAEDNLENILFRYLVLHGRSSEVFGKEFVDTDWFVQAYNILEDAKIAYEELDLPIKENYAAYIAGIKAFMRDEPGKIPTWWQGQVELEPYLPTAFLHWLNVIFSVSYGMSDCAVGSADIQLNDLRFVDNTIVDTRAAISHASNQMGIMNRKTRGNVAYLISDPHVTFTAKRSEMRIHAGDLNVSGIVVAGYVSPMLGHTENVAWAHTTGFPDVADCYVFEVDSHDSGSYIFEGKLIPFTRKAITVPIRGQSPQIREQLFVQKNGLMLPVHAIRDGKAYVSASGDLLRPGGQDRTSYYFSRAETVDDLISALGNGHFAQNIMAADTRGNLIYVRMGTTAIRPQGDFDWSAPVPGGTAATDWLGIHAVSDLVQARNPTAGYLQNNNVSADRMAADSDLPESLNPGIYPEYIYNGAGSSHARGLRAVEILSAMEDVEYPDVLALATDEKWISSILWQDALAETMERNPDWDDAAQSTRLFASRIIDFDGFGSKQSVGAMNLAAWLHSLGDDQESAKRLKPKVLASEPLSEADYSFMLEALFEAEEKLRSKFGEGEIDYGDVFKLKRGNTEWPLGGGVISIPGVWSEQTMRAYDFSPEKEDFGKQIAHRGGVHPQIMTLKIGGTVDSNTAVAFGQSHDPASAHFSDQSRLLSEKKLKPSFFQFESLKTNIESWKTLSVEYMR